MEWLGIIALGALGIIFLACLAKAIAILHGPPKDMK